MKRIMYRLMNEVRYWVFSYKSLPIEKRMRIPLYLGIIPACLFILVEIIFSINNPVFEIIVFMIFSVSLYVTGLFMLILKKNPFVPEAPGLAQPMGIIFSLEGFLYLLKSISDLIVQL